MLTSDSGDTALLDLDRAGRLASWKTRCAVAA